MTDLKLSPFWTVMNKDEKFQHFQEVEQNLMQRRYEYYVLDRPSISDPEYDVCERYLELIGQELGLRSKILDMVGYDLAF